MLDRRIFQQCMGQSVFLTALAAFGIIGPSGMAWAQLSAAGPSAGTSSAPGASDIVANGGLGVRIVFIGRNKDGQRLTISAQITNLNEQTAHVALIGSPSAVNNTGETFTLETVSGMGFCRRELSQCLSSRAHLPVAQFSEIQPQANVAVALTFSASDASETEMLSIALNIAMALGDAPWDPATNPIRNISVSFPLVEF